MEHKYKFYIVIDGVEEMLEMDKNQATEQEAQDFLRAMRDAEGVWVGLANGDMVSISQYVSKNVYFKAKRVADDGVS